MESFVRFQHSTTLFGIKRISAICLYSLCHAKQELDTFDHSLFLSDFFFLETRLILDFVINGNVISLIAIFAQKIHKASLKMKPDMENIWQNHRRLLTYNI